MQASSLQTCGQDVRTNFQYRYGFESGKAFLINSTRGSASLSDDNFHYVETEKYIRVLEHSQPGERAA